MHIGGRFTLARGLTPAGLTPSLVIARPRAQWPATIARYRKDDFFITKGGVCVPAIRGGSWSSSLQLPLGPTLGNWALDNPTNTTLALNSNYTFGSAGAAVGGRLKNMPLTKTLNSIYFNLSAGGTANDILCALHAESAGLPSGAAIESVVKDPASGTGWFAATGFTSTMTQDTPYVVSVADPDGATDLATAIRNNDLWTAVGNASFDSFFDALQTTTGWASGNTLVRQPPTIVLGFSDATAIGNPFATNAATTSNQEQRGFYINAFTEQIKVLGLVSVSTSANFSGVNLWEGSAGPSGGATATGAVDVFNGASTPALCGMLLTAPYTCAKATVYRIVFTYSSNTALPRKLQIGTGADATLKAAMLGAGGVYFASAAGTNTTWGGDDAAAWPGAVLLLEDQVAVATGGGGMRMAGHGGLAA